MASLDTKDRLFLAALREGKSAAEYARENNYSVSWARWRSRRIRNTYGKTTIREVVAMSEVTREDLDALRRDFTNALRDLKDAATPRERQDARQEIASLDEELRRYGISREDLDRLKDEKEYQRYKSFEDRRQKEREAEEKSKREQEEADAQAQADREAEEKKEQERDGLGGRRRK